MELAIVYDLEPTKPEDFDKDASIKYRCRECGEVILGYNTQTHAFNFHQTELFVLKNYVQPPTLESPPSV